MNLNDSEKIKRKLKGEYNDNCLKIDELDEKIMLINENDFETRATNALAFSIIPWGGASMFLMQTIVQSGIVPLNMIQPLFVGVPALIGIIGEELFTRKSKWRERLRNFSKSKTQKEKLEESTKYEIEKAKLISANMVLKQTYDDLSANENLISSLSTSYNVTEKDVDARTKEEIADNIENINKDWQKKQQEVDIATTKSVLKRVKDKFNNFFDILIAVIMGGMMSMMIYDMPIIYLNQLENIQFQASFLGILAPAIVGGLACGGYCVKRRINHTFVFKTINSELGDNAISEFRDYEEDTRLDTALEDVIKDTSAVKLKLESEKQKLNHASETPSELQLHSATTTMQMSCTTSEMPLEDMMSFREESIFEESSTEEGHILEPPTEQGHILKMKPNKK